MHLKYDVPKIKLPKKSSCLSTNKMNSMLLKWANFASSHYGIWDKMPNCGHFFGGVYNYEIETTSTMSIFAVLSTIGHYDETIIGVKKEQAINMVISSIRYLCYTHYIGPKQYKRGKSKNTMTSEKKWGFTENNFFMSSQTGVSISMLGLSSLLLWDYLDIETKNLVGDVITFYADHFSKLLPGTGVYNDTQCEENAWTSLGISAALYMFPHHKNHTLWEDAFIRWSYNTVTTPNDKLNNEWDKVSYKVRNGFKYKDKTYGVSSVTFHPDFTTENHGYVHPDYIGAGIVLRISSYVFPLILGKKLINSVTYNFENLYNKLIKPWCQIDGNIIPVQGQDWFYHRHSNKLLMHSTMDLLFNDSIAKKLKLNCLDVIEKRQNSALNGCFIEKNGNELQINPGKQSVQDMEYGYARSILISYLFHLYIENNTNDITNNAILEKLEGNYFYPYGDISIYRTKSTFSSFTTRGTIMGLSLPKNGIWDITPAFQSYTGIIKKYTQKEKKISRLMSWDNIAKNSIKKDITKYEKGFSTTTKLIRANNDITQLCSFSALDNGNCVYIESLFNNKKKDIYQINTGLIGIGNENFKDIKIAKGYKDIYFNSNKVTFLGNYKGEDTILKEKNINYINIDNKIGYLLFNSHGIKYTNVHNYIKWKGLEDLLILNNIDNFDFKDPLAPLFIISLPNSTDKQTLHESILTFVTSNNKLTPVIRTNDYRVSVNFDTVSSDILESFIMKNTRLNLFTGTTTIINDLVECRYKHKSFSSHISLSKGYILFDKPYIKKMLEFSVYDDKIFISNIATKKIQYTVVINSKNYAINHMPGKLLQMNL